MKEYYNTERKMTTWMIVHFLVGVTFAHLWSFYPTTILFIITFANLLMAALLMATLVVIKNKQK